MTRLHIDLPEKFGFTTRIPIRIGDINRAAHLSHVNLVGILEEARAQFMVKHGFGDEVRIVKSQESFILGDLSVIFKQQGFYGQTLEVAISAVDFSEKSFNLVYRASETVSGEEVARARTAILVFNYQMQKVVPISTELKRELSDAQL
jgi:acyl-CoA thioester hydrolase